MIKYGRLIGLLASALIAHSAQAHGVQLQAFAKDEPENKPFAVLGARASTANQSPPLQQVIAQMREWAFPRPLAEGTIVPEVVETCSVALLTPPPFLTRVARMRRASLSLILRSIACEEGVAPALLDALVAHESRYNPAALSHRGAIGLTQLMPGTVAALGIANPWDAAQNLRGGARYLRRQLDAFGRYDLALAAYNAGPGNVARYNGVPPFRETRAYVDNVLGMMLGSSGVSPTKVGVPLTNLLKRPGKPVTDTALVQQFLGNASARQGRPHS